MRICWNSSRKLWYRTPDAAISYRQTGKYWNSAVLAACMRCRNMRRRTSHNLPPTASRHDEVVHSSRMQSIWVQQIVLVSQLRDNPIKLSICANERVVDVCNVYWLSILDWLFNHANDPMKISWMSGHFAFETCIGRVLRTCFPPARTILSRNRCPWLSGLSPYAICTDCRTRFK